MNFYKFNRIIFVFSVTVCLEMTKAGCDGSGDGVLRRFCWADLLALPAARRAWFGVGRPVRGDEAPRRSLPGSEDGVVQEGIT